VFEPFGFLSVVATNILKMFDPGSRRLDIKYPAPVSKALETWGFEDTEYVKICDTSTTRLLMALGDASTNEMLSESERQNLSLYSEQLLAHIGTTYENMNVRSPDIYDIFFGVSMIVYVFSFFIFTTYRNCQQFTPLVAPIIIAIVFGPYVIGKILQGPFALHTIYKGNKFTQWLNMCQVELALYASTLADIYRGTNQALNLTPDEFFDQKVSEMNQRRAMVRMEMYQLRSKHLAVQ
jgi:hypothetical protein